MLHVNHRDIDFDGLHLVVDMHAGRLAADRQPVNLADSTVHDLGLLVEDMRLCRHEVVHPWVVLVHSTRVD